MRKLLAVFVGFCCFLVVAGSPVAAEDVTGDDADLAVAAATRFFVDESSLPFAAVPGFEDSQRLWGVSRGAGYRIEVPANWNGDVMFWTHGFRGTGDRLFFNPEEFVFRPWLLEQGFAWAASTYSENNYAVGPAVTDTRRLATLFRQLVDRPDEMYIAGTSMGGHVAAASIERYPNFYDGILPACANLGGWEHIDYVLDFNVTAQQLALGESQFPVGPDYPAEIAPLIKANLESEPGGWPTALNETGESFKQLVELRSGGDRPNFDEAWAFWNSVPNFGSGIPGNLLFDLGFFGDFVLREGSRRGYDNTDVFYETDLIPGPSNEIEVALNDEVVRVRPESGARRLTINSAVADLRGYLREPVLTMHNLGDLFVPFHNQVEYHRRVAASRQSEMLVQRAIRGSLHCDFTESEWVSAFADLVAWVEYGIRPDGDDVGDPAAVADENFGCRFTDPTPGAHLFATPCPAE